MENRIKDLEVDIRIAEARAEMTLRYINYFCDELGRSGIINWSADDLKRGFLNDSDYDLADTAMAYARLDLEIRPGDDGYEWAEAVDRSMAYVRLRAELRAKIASEIKHEQPSPS